MRIEQIKKEYQIVVRWRAFPLHPDTPEDGLRIEDLFAGQPADVDQMMRHLGQKAAELGLPFGDREKTYNSRLAQELGAWAESKRQGHAFHMAAFKAYFVHGKNIAKIPVLLDLASAVGLSRDEAAFVLSDRTFKAAVDRDWLLSKGKGVTAVPTFVLNRDRLVGAQPYLGLEKMMIANGVEKRDK